MVYHELMNSVIDILEKLESDNSRLFKEEVLENNRKNKLLHRIFCVVGDPYINFYVAKFKEPKLYQRHDEDDIVVESFLNLLENELSTRHITGNEAKNAVEKFFLTLDERQAKWCTRILLKNLRCGVQETTVNKVWPGSITKFSVQLAETLRSRFEKEAGIIIEDSLKYPVRVEPKLDGLRCIAVKHQGAVTMFTRNGTILDTLPTIKAVLEAAPWDNFVLDGEAMGSDWNESASVVMSRKKAKDDSGIVYHVFDGMHFDDWRDQANNFSLVDRVELVEELLGQLPKDAPVKQVSGTTVKDQKGLLTFYAKTMESGYEGIMVKDLSSNYSFKRSNAVLKLKPITTYEGVVVGHYEGRRGSKREGLWGGFNVVLPNGIVTHVGGGFTDKLKAEIGLEPQSWIGKVIEIEGQPDPLTKDGLTKDGKIRFPVYLRTRDSADVDPRVLAAAEAFLS
jgi:ATP-dependent DNA ligase